MAGHSSLDWRANAAPDARIVSSNEADAWIANRCGYCGEKGNNAVLVTSRQELALWGRCTSCGFGFVINEGRQSPPPLPGEDLDGLPADVADAYAEARRCLGVG